MALLTASAFNKDFSKIAQDVPHFDTAAMFRIQNQRLSARIRKISGQSAGFCKTWKKFVQIRQLHFSFARIQERTLRLCRTVCNHRSGEAPRKRVPNVLLSAPRKRPHLLAKICVPTRDAALESATALASTANPRGCAPTRTKAHLPRNPSPRHIHLCAAAPSPCCRRATALSQKRLSTVTALSYATK